jgi:hypothetical protein
MAMTPVVAIVTSLVFITLAGMSEVHAAGFECDWRPAPDIRIHVPVGNALDDPQALNAHIDALRKQGLSRAFIIDNLIAAYCPIVAADSAISDTAKTSKIEAFAARITRIVYSVESATDIIVSVPLRPDIVDAVNAKAREAGMTTVDWIVRVINVHLKQ